MSQQLKKFKFPRISRLIYFSLALRYEKISSAPWFFISLLR